MVNTTIDKLSPTRVKLTIAVSPDELRPGIDKAYKTIAEQIEIPGFRKGKVPAPIIDQRVGKGAVLEQAVNDNLDEFYREAVNGSEIRPLGRPSADVTTWPDGTDFSGDLQIEVEVDVRPEFEMPAYEDLTITVDSTVITDEEVDAELDRLRTRFGTLITVDRPARTGDFAQLDLIATIDGVEVDAATGISYELGSGELLTGIDDALDTLTAGESTTFTSKLLGGEHEGEDAEIAVTLTAVKERELPAADDDFAQIASEFDTIAELRESLKGQVAGSKAFDQGRQARDKLIEAMLEKVEIPVPEAVILEEVHRHLENESRLEDDEHRAEVTEASEKALRNQILLDSLAETFDVKVSQDELTQYLVQASAQYGMEPNEFVKVLDQGNQIPAMVGEVARNKALSIALGKVTVVDTDGAPVDLSDFAVDEDADEIDHTGHDHGDLAEAEDDTTDASAKAE